MISGLILAFILNLFGFGQIMIQGISELTGYNISMAGYYVIFFAIGLVLDLIRR